MKHAVLVSIFIVLSFTTTLAQEGVAVVRPESGTWIELAPANQGFTVRMPGKAVEKVQPVSGRSDLEHHLFTVETELAGYVFSYVQFPDEVTDPATIKLMLDSGRAGGIGASGGELKSEKDIKLGDYLGREWSITMAGGLAATARAYWVKRRLYQAIFVFNSGVTSAEVIKLRNEAQTKFLDSFALTAAVKQ